MSTKDMLRDWKALVAEYEGKPKADAPKSAHKKGERFEGKVFAGTSNPVQEGHHLCYAGKIGSPRGQYCVSRVDGEAIWGGDSSTGEYEILTLVLDEPKPKYTVGQYVYALAGGCLAVVARITGNGRQWRADTDDWRIIPIGCTHAASVSPHDIRPAVPADFDVTVGNMKVRAYEFNSRNDNVYWIWSNSSAMIVPPDVAAALGYPIIPLSVSGGKFEAPKGE